MPDICDVPEISSLVLNKTYIIKTDGKYYETEIS